MKILYILFLKIYAMHTIELLNRHNIFYDLFFFLLPVLINSLKR